MVMALAAPPESHKNTSISRELTILHHEKLVSEQVAEGMCKEARFEHRAL